MDNKNHGLRFDSGKPEPIEALEVLYDNMDNLLGKEFFAFVFQEKEKYPEDKSTIADNYPIDEDYLHEFDALHKVTQLSHYGAVVKGYGRSNWKLGMKWSRVVNSLLRHLIRFWIFREDRDPESGIHHTTAIMWNAMALATYQFKELGEDDRVTKVEGFNG